MKNQLIGLFLIVTLSSCYTKKGALERFCTQDTAKATIIVHDTLIVERVVADTIFSASIDSVVVTKDRLVISYKKVLDKIYLTGECKGDTIVQIKEVKVAIPCNQIKYTRLDHAKKVWHLFIWIIFLSFAIGFIIGIRRK